MQSLRAGAPQGFARKVPRNKITWGWGQLLLTNEKSLCDVYSCPHTQTTTQQPASPIQSATKKRKAYYQKQCMLYSTGIKHCSDMPEGLGDAFHILVGEL
jgi:hypothetical protein